MKLKNTKLQLIEFGDDSSDKYYCLVDLNVSPAGLNLQKMRLTNPRDIDREFRKSGCLMMFTGEEIEELVNRGDLDRNELHESLFRLAISEGVIKSG